MPRNISLDSYPACLEEFWPSGCLSGQDPNCHHFVCNPYSIGPGHVSGWFTTSTPVPPSSGGVGTNVIDFSFSDGVITWTSTNSTLGVCVVTDSQGQITEGSVASLMTSSQPYEALNAWTGPPCSGSAVEGAGFADRNCAPFDCTDGQYILAEGSVYGNPGTWAEEVPPHRST